MIYNIQHPPSPNCAGCLQSNCKPKKCETCEDCNSLPNVSIDYPLMAGLIFFLILIIIFKTDKL